MCVYLNGCGCVASLCLSRVLKERTLAVEMESFASGGFEAKET